MSLTLIPLRRAPLHRLFSTSAPALAITRRAVKNKWDIAKIGPDVGNDPTSMGHRLIRERRELLQYLRLIEYDIPRLASEFTKQAFGSAIRLFQDLGNRLRLLRPKPPSRFAHLLMAENLMPQNTKRLS